jgi:hypothetical protein
VRFFAFFSWFSIVFALKIGLGFEREFGAATATARLAGAKAQEDDTEEEQTSPFFCRCHTKNGFCDEWMESYKKNIKLQDLKRKKHRVSRILVAPLNWGLGHATRCIPLIQTLLALGKEPILASDGEALALLREEFPDLPSVELPSYKVRYPSQNMLWNMAWQLPRLLRTPQLERQTLRHIIQSQGIEGIISDNRYGLGGLGLPSALMTHQTQILIRPVWLQALVARLNRHFIGQFSQCWIPDWPAEDERALTGILSQAPLPVPKVYLGALSRLSFTPSARHWDLLILLSGPEPQRSLWEAEIVAQWRALALPPKTLLVRGTRLAKPLAYCPGLAVVDLLASTALQEALASSAMVLCRSGYSTLMDLAVFGQHRVFLVPTPGQTEQEYLAQNLQKKAGAVVQKQVNFDLAAGLSALTQQTPFPKTDNEPRLWEKAIFDLFP